MKDNWERPLPLRGLPPEGNASTYIILLLAAAGQASQHGELQGECMATSDHDVSITAGRRMVEGRKAGAVTL